MGYPHRYITPATATPATDTLVRKGRTNLKGWYGFNTDATLANVIYTGNILLKGSIIQG